MRLRYNFRLYPTPGQCQSLARAFGCARTVFNDGLRARREAREAGLAYLSEGELSKKIITQAKGSPERAWLGEVSAVVLQQALADLNAAYRNFFASLSGKRKGRRPGPPRFRSRKDSRQAIRFTKNARFTVTPGGKLRLPKIGDVPVAWSRSLPSEASSVTVIKDSAGRYFASFVVETSVEVLPETDSEIGIDLGLTHFAIMSDGRKVANPRILRRAAKKLRRAQKALSRKEKGSANRTKAKAKVAKAYAKVADTRRDFAHKLSTTLIRDNQAVYVEDLAVSGLARTRLAKSVHDAGWSQFTAMLEYKARRYGRTFRQDRPLVPQLEAVLGVRDHRGQDDAQRPIVDLPVRGRPRPGHERGDQHPGRRTGGQAKRLWSAGKTGRSPGTAPRSSNPPEAHAADGNRRPLGRRGCQISSMRLCSSLRPGETTSST